MSRAETITLRADASQAKAELAELGAEAHGLGGSARAGAQGLGRALEKLEEQGEQTADSVRGVAEAGHGLGGGLERLSILAVGFSSALEIGGRAVEMLTGGIESLTSQSSEGEAAMERMSSRVDAMRSSLMLAVLGASDADEATGQLDRALAMVQGTVEELAGGVNGLDGQLVSLTQRGLSAAVEGMGLAARAGHGLAQTWRISQVAAEGARYGVLAFGESLAFIAASVAERATGALGEVAGAFGSVAHAGQSIAERLGIGVVASALDDVGDGLVRGSNRADEWSASLEQVRQELARMGEEAGSRYHARIEEIGDAMLDSAADAAGLQDALADLGERIAAGEVVGEVRREHTGGVSEETQAIDEQAVAYDEANHRREVMIALAEKEMDLEALHAESVRAEAEAKEEAAARMEAADASRMEAINHRREAMIALAEKERERQEEERERIAGMVEPYEAFAEAGLEALGGVIAGADGAGRAMVQAVGNELQARGIAWGIQAIAEAFTPGLQAAAAGHAAASAAALVAGGIMLRSGRAPSSGGAIATGAAAPATASNSAPAVTNTTTTVVNFQSLAATRETQRAVANAVREANRNGY